MPRTPLAAIAAALTLLAAPAFAQTLTMKPLPVTKTVISDSVTASASKAFLPCRRQCLAATGACWDRCAYLALPRACPPADSTSWPPR